MSDRIAGATDIEARYFLGHAARGRHVVYCAILASLISCLLSSNASAQEAHPDRGAAEMEIIRTRDYEIHFSARAGLPVKWDLLLPPHALDENRDQAHQKEEPVRRCQEALQSGLAESASSDVSKSV
jgi:hypothetical protein